MVGRVAEEPAGHRVDGRRVEEIGRAMDVGLDGDSFDAHDATIATDESRLSIRLPTAGRSIAGLIAEVPLGTIGRCGG
ncbi:hypothetical protein Aph02nite_59180 [Actinoplanes philippinensis]|nr:hypothetical protein Aph02nite_59180 [Actinoplanes philippinensis]